MKQITAKFDFSAAENGEGFLFFFLSEIGSFESAKSDCLCHADPALIGGAGHLIEIFREIEVFQEESRVAFDKWMVEQTLKDLTDGSLARLDGLGFMTVEPALAKILLLCDFERIVIICLHFAYHSQNCGESYMH